MRNYILNSIKNFFKKTTISKAFLQAFLTSFISLLLLLVIGLGLVWHYRASVFDYFAKEYLKNAQSSESIKDSAEKIVERQSIFSQESFVINAVKKANPAVVSIIISQDVPKYEAYTEQLNPFGNIPGMPNFFFNIPQYRQNGTEKKEVGGGSGFFVSQDGLIVTNKHVVDQKNAEYTVFTNNGKKYLARVVAKDPVLDIALIKIDGFSYPYLDLGNSDSLQAGQSVIAIGNALGEFRNTVSVGVISGLARSVIAGDNKGNTELLDQVIQTDAAINPGNSGGPLLDLAGKVVGVNVAVVQGSQSIGFALPINSVKSAINSVKSTGKIVRPYLGIRYVQITPELKQANNLSVDYGILVKGGGQNELAVIPGSPADKAGIVENDIILEVDGKKIDDQTSLASLIRQKNIGDIITLKVLHRGEEKTVQAKLEPAPES
jgi:serine protease Do